MSIRSSIEKVKEAVSNRDMVSYLCHYLVRDGRIHATDGRITASAPFPGQESYLVPADEFEKILDILGETSTIAITETHLVLSTKGRKAKIKILAPEEFDCLRPEGEKLPIPASLKQQLLQMRAFVSTDQARFWACCVKLRGQAGQGQLIATNNVVVCQKECGGNFPDVEVSITSRILDCLAKNTAALTHISVSERSVTFYLDDNSRITGLLPAEDFPPQIWMILEHEVTPDFELSHEWKEEIRKLFRIASDEVFVYADKLRSAKRHGDLEIEIPGFAEEGKERTVWNPKFFEAVVDNATLFKSVGGIGYWSGVNIKGVIAGRHEHG